MRILTANTTLNNDPRLKQSITKSGEDQYKKYYSQGLETIPGGFIIIELYNNEYHDEDTLKIPFELYNTRVANIWLTMFNALDNDNFKSKRMDWTWSKKYERQIEQTLLHNINSTIKNLNAIGYNYSFLKECNEESTNDLHHTFEHWGAEEKEKGKVIGYSKDRHLSNLMYTLNENIHSIEYYSRSKKQGNRQYPGLKINGVWNPKISIPLIDEDWNEAICLPGSSIFGQLCIGYSTLGKDLHSGILDQDGDLFERDMVTPQELFSNEIVVKLDHVQSVRSLIHYRKMWKKINPEKYEYGNFIKNREGRIAIGKVLNRFLSKNCNGVGLNKDLSKYTDYKVYFYEK